MRWGFLFLLLLPLSLRAQSTTSPRLLPVPRLAVLPVSALTRPLPVPPTASAQLSPLRIQPLSGPAWRYTPGICWDIQYSLSPHFRMRIAVDNLRFTQ